MERRSPKLSLAVTTRDARSAASSKLTGSIPRNPEKPLCFVSHKPLSIKIASFTKTNEAERNWEHLIRHSSDKVHTDSYGKFSFLGGARPQAETGSL